MGFYDLPANHLGAERVAILVRREMNVEVWNSAAKDVYVDQLGLGRFLQGARDSGEYGPQRPRFIAIKVGDMRNVAFRFEIRESRNFSFQGRCESPMGVLPNLDSPEL
jgi:hypothetical protein